MKQLFSGWRHVFKLDPDRMISDEQLALLCQSGTDAIMVGGSLGVTYANTEDLLVRLRQYEIPCVLEISDQEAIVAGFDLYFIPIVLNTDDARWMIGHHQQAVKRYGQMMPWNQVVTEGYVILNEHSAVARRTMANTQLKLSDVIAYAQIAEKLFHLAIVYIEYSGTFGNMEWVSRTTATMQHARVFYGGGIDSSDKAIQAAQAAHTIVVGNVIYDDFQQALATVHAVQAVQEAQGIQESQEAQEVQVWDNTE